MSAAAPYDPHREVPDFHASDRDAVSRLVIGEADGPVPRVSIVVPTFRRAGLLAETLDSALSQVDFTDFEVIVVDNDAEPATRETEDLIRRLDSTRMRYYRNARNLGMTGNWNRGLLLARGEWITLLHDDDWLSPRFLQRMFERMPADASVMCCKVQLGPAGYDPALLRTPKPRHGRVVIVHPRQFVLGNISPAPGVLIRRSLALRLRGFDPALYPCADYDFNIRAMIDGGAYWIGERLAYYRNAEGETFKGDTFERIIWTSAWIKRGLMQRSPSLSSRLYYLDSMRNWYRRALRLGRSITPQDALDRFALLAARSRPMSKILRNLVRFAAWTERRYR